MTKRSTDEFRLPSRHPHIGTDLKDSIDALPLGVSYRAEPIPRHSARDKPGDIRDNEPQRAAANATDEAPKGAGRPSRAVLRHAMFAQHLLKSVSELLFFRPTACVVVVGRRPSSLLTLTLALSLAGEKVPRPREGVLRARAAGGGVFALLGRGALGIICFSKGVAGRGGAGTEHLALEIVLASPGGVGEGVVGVVDELEFPRSDRSLGRVAGHPIGMRFQCSPFMDDKSVDGHQKEKRPAPLRKEAVDSQVNKKRMGNALLVGIADFLCRSCFLNLKNRI